MFLSRFPAPALLLAALMLSILIPNHAFPAEADDNQDWFPFAPKVDPFEAKSGFDLRSLNEKTAGEGGFITVKDGHFVHSQSGKAVRFWAVNGPAGKDPAELRKEARMLAKHGVNLVRIHHGYFNDKGEIALDEVKKAISQVEALKAEGIYTHFSIYFPLWLKPKPGTAWLQGYDGQKPALAALYFNKDFQKKYQEWWEGLLTTPSPTTGKRLIDDPAVMGAEIINEDSYFFWTFSPENIPDEQMRILETQFGDWLKKKYGSLDKAQQAWGNVKVKRDDPANGRMSFRPLYNMFSEKTPRDKDAVRFLLESQRAFYQETHQFLRKLGFKGVITASNWATASPEVFGPLEKYSYTVGDFIDRHGYFSCHSEGKDAAWSIQKGQTYIDRSALRFEPEVPGKPLAFVHPGMDPKYDGKPSMISETTWNRPNRYRSEAPLYYAVYGALQDTDAIVHFAQDSTTWSVKPNYFMQPWTLMSPAMMGQFPATALLYRKGLVDRGDVLLELNLKRADLLDLQGTPLPQDAAFDELRLKDVPKGTELKPGNRIDPLIHMAGRVNVNFTEEKKPSKLQDLSSLIQRDRKMVKSSNGQVQLDYGKGVLSIDAPAAQGVSGSLREAGPVKLKDLQITSQMELGHIIAVSLDDKPLATSEKILLQVMSEEKTNKFQTEPAMGPVKRIVNIGEEPWQVRKLDGVVKFTRADAGKLKVTALDFNGYPVKEVGTAAEVKLQPEVVYYLITP